MKMEEINHLEAAESIAFRRLSLLRQNAVSAGHGVWDSTASTSHGVWDSTASTNLEVDLWWHRQDPALPSPKAASTQPDTGCPSEGQGQFYHRATPQPLVFQGPLMWRGKDNDGNCLSAQRRKRLASRLPLSMSLAWFPSQCTGGSHCRRPHAGAAGGAGPGLPWQPGSPAAAGCWSGPAHLCYLFPSRGLSNWGFRLPMRGSGYVRIAWAKLHVSRCTLGRYVLTSGSACSFLVLTRFLWCPRHRARCVWEVWGALPHN